MAKKTGPAERRAYIEQQREAEARHKGSGRRIPMNMTFIERDGNMPTEADYEASIGRVRKPPFPPTIQKNMDLAKTYEEQGRLREASRAYRAAGDQVNATRVMQDYLGRRGYTKERLTGTAAVLGLLGGLFFLSFNLTGNIIADSSIKTTSFIGIGLLVIGLIAGAFWLNNRRK